MLGEPVVTLDEILRNSVTLLPTNPSGWFNSSRGYAVADTVKNS